MKAGKEDKSVVYSIVNDLLLQRAEPCLYTNTLSSYNCKTAKTAKQIERQEGPLGSYISYKGADWKLLTSSEAVVKPDKVIPKSKRSNIVRHA
nr:hypothetical protein Itr_chr10CG17690 [Ipomoea trifida]